MKCSKKLWALFLSIVMVLALAACGGSGNEADGRDGEDIPKENVAQDDVNNTPEAAAEKYLTAFYTGDFDTVVDLTHPAQVDLTMGAAQVDSKEALAKALQDEMDFATLVGDDYKISIRVIGTKDSDRDDLKKIQERLVELDLETLGINDVKLVELNVALAVGNETLDDRQVAAMTKSDGKWYCLDLTSDAFSSTMDDATQDVINAFARAIRSAGMVQVLTEDIPGGEGGWLVTATIDKDTSDISIQSISPAEADASDVLPDTPYGTYQVVVDPV